MVVSDFLVGFRYPSWQLSLFQYSFFICIVSLKFHQILFPPCQGRISFSSPLTLSLGFCIIQRTKSLCSSKKDPSFLSVLVIQTSQLLHGAFFENIAKHTGLCNKFISKCRARERRRNQMGK